MRRGRLRLLGGRAVLTYAIVDGSRLSDRRLGGRSGLGGGSYVASLWNAGGAGVRVRSGSSICVSDGFCVEALLGTVLGCACFRRDGLGSGGHLCGRGSFCVGNLLRGGVLVCAGFCRGGLSRRSGLRGSCGVLGDGSRGFGIGSARRAGVCSSGGFCVGGLVAGGALVSVAFGDRSLGGDRILGGRCRGSCVGNAGGAGVGGRGRLRGRNLLRGGVLVRARFGHSGLVSRNWRRGSCGVLGGGSHGPGIRNAGRARVRSFSFGGLLPGRVLACTTLGN